MSQSNELTIKGTRNGLVINMPDDGEFDRVLEQLESRLKSTAAFFKGGRVALQVGWRSLSAQDIERIGQLLDKQGVSLWSVFSHSESTQRAAKELGLEIESGVSRRPGDTKQTADKGKGDQALFVQRTLRSGQRLEHSGHIIVIGDVNPGAEIVAGGNVVVWGKLRGTVHAGAAGNDGSVVCALSLYPTQLRIGNHIARSPELGPPRTRSPEMASVQDDEIIAEPWLSG